ncbi:MAG: peptidoglycan DD-metalloendopeptidase family protein [Planctomycetota bacterium]|jgi:murein DD-endopeptidase MepM/ murein hydrolase activator NlpD
MIYRWDDEELRGVDPKGSGMFAAGRGSKRHKGVDYRKAVGQDVKTPVAGIVTRLGWCYKDEPYRLVEILSHKGAFLWRVLYVDPCVESGAIVKSGQTIGQAQDIASKYGGGMINHVHVEVSIDPTLLIGGKNG